MLEIARRRHLGPARLGTAYVVLALVWIAFSDLLLGLMIDDASLLSRLQTVKGVAFVLVTGALLYVFIRRDSGIIAGAATELAEADREQERAVMFARFNPNPVLVLGSDAEVLYQNDGAARLAREAGLDIRGLLPEEVEQLTADCLGRGEAVRPGIRQVGIVTASGRCSHTPLMRLSTHLRRIGRRRFCSPPG